MVDKNDALFREVEEELRRERMEKLWEQYGIYVIAAAALIVAFVGGYKYWEWRNISLAQENGAKYEAAITTLSAGKTDDAAKAFQEIAAGGHGGYAVLADLQLAGVHLKAGRTAEAAVVFERISGDGAVDKMIRDFATIQAATLKVGDAGFTELQNRLNDLAADGNPWRFGARELLGLAAYKAGKLDEARKIFEPLLADPGTPAGTLERIKVVMGSIAAAELSSRASPSAAAPAAPGAAK